MTWSVEVDGYIVDMSDAPEFESIYNADQHLHAEHPDLVARIALLQSVCKQLGWNASESCAALMAAGARISVGDNWTAEECSEYAYMHHAMMMVRETIARRAKAANSGKVRS